MAEIRRTRAETFRHNHGFDPMPRALGRKPMYSEFGLLAQVRERRKELGLDQLPFEERLREPELDAEAWLVEHGWPQETDDDWPDEEHEDWKEMKW